MKFKVLLAAAGFVMIVLSLTALTTETTWALDAQCSKRCRCDASPCGSRTYCQDGFGVWTNCCAWCSTLIK
jgi:hypothetical protein